MGIQEKEQGKYDLMSNEDKLNFLNNDKEYAVDDEIVEFFNEYSFRKHGISSLISDSHYHLNLLKTKNK